MADLELSQRSRAFGCRPSEASGVYNLEVLRCRHMPVDLEVIAAGDRAKVRACTAGGTAQMRRKKVVGKAIIPPAVRSSRFDSVTV